MNNDYYCEFCKDTGYITIQAEQVFDPIKENVEWRDDYKVKCTAKVHEKEYDYE